MNLPPYGGTMVEPAPVGGINPAVRAVRALCGRHPHSRDFWLLSATFFVCGASTNGLIGTHLIPACFDHGIPEVRAAGLLALMGIFDFIGTTGSGWLTDRVDSRKLLVWYYASAWPLADFSAVFVRLQLLRALALRRLLRARLDRHGTADGAPRRKLPSASKMRR